MYRLSKLEYTIYNTVWPAYTWPEPEIHAISLVPPEFKRNITWPTQYACFLIYFTRYISGITKYQKLYFGSVLWESDISLGWYVAENNIVSQNIHTNDTINVSVSIEGPPSEYIDIVVNIDGIDYQYNNATITDRYTGFQLNLYNSSMLAPFNIYTDNSKKSFLFEEQQELDYFIEAEFYPEATYLGISSTNYYKMQPPHTYVATVSSGTLSGYYAKLFYYPPYISDICKLHVEQAMLYYSNKELDNIIKQKKYPQDVLWDNPDDPIEVTNGIRHSILSINRANPYIYFIYGYNDDDKEYKNELYYVKSTDGFRNFTKYHVLDENGNNLLIDNGMFLYNHELNTWRYLGITGNTAKIYNIINENTFKEHSVISNEISTVSCIAYIVLNGEDFIYLNKYPIYGDDPVITLFKSSDGCVTFSEETITLDGYVLTFDIVFNPLKGCIFLYPNEYRDPPHYVYMSLDGINFSIYTTESYYGIIGGWEHNAITRSIYYHDSIERIDPMSA